MAVLCRCKSLSMLIVYVFNVIKSNKMRSKVKDCTFLSLIMSDKDLTWVLKCFKSSSVVKLMKRFMRNEGFNCSYTCSVNCIWRANTLSPNMSLVDRGFISRPVLPGRCVEQVFYWAPQFFPSFTGDRRDASLETSKVKSPKPLEPASGPEAIYQPLFARSPCCVCLCVRLHLQIYYLLYVLFLTNKELL